MAKLVIFSFVLLLAVAAYGLKFKEDGCGPTCDGYECEYGDKCELVQVTCIRAPCYPQPTCVPDNSVNTCRNVKCTTGHICKMIQVQCFVAPCPPMPQCVPDSSQ